MPRKLVTTSKVASSHGRSSMSPARRSASGLRSRATAIRRGDASIPAHRAPRRPASSTDSPAPQATSSSRSPAPTPRRWCRATYSRQLVGSQRAANSAACRPQPSSTPLHWSPTRPTSTTIRPDVGMRPPVANRQSDPGTHWEPGPGRDRHWAHGEELVLPGLSMMLGREPDCGTRLDRPSQPTIRPCRDAPEQWVGGWGRQSQGRGSVRTTDNGSDQASLPLSHTSGRNPVRPRRQPLNPKEISIRPDVPVGSSSRTASTGRSRRENNRPGPGVAGHPSRSPLSAGPWPDRSR